MTPLRVALSARNVPLERLKQSELAADRLEALLHDAEPSIDELRKIARLLRLPFRELLVDPIAAKGETKLRTNFGRNISTELELEAAQATDRARVLGDFIAETGLPVFKGFPKSAATAEELSVIVRRNLLESDDIEPLPNLAGLFYDKLGVATVITHFRSIEGASSRAGGAAIILLASRPSGRMRFTLCHELCHLLVDLEPKEDEVWLDDAVLSPRQDSNYEEEAFANAFASSLLLPARGVAKVLRGFREAHGGPPDGVSAPEILNIARKFGTSFLVTGIRLEAMEVLPSGAAQALQESLTKEYGSPEKFANSIGLPEAAHNDWKYPAKKMFEDFGTRFSRGDYSIEFISGVSGLTLREAMGAYHDRGNN